MRSSTLLAVLLVALFAISSVRADIYLNSPRGSNNRLDEANRDRTNANRLFNSQNNDRGGMNVGSVYYYTGSIVTFEWTAQHSCGDKTRANCELILQYTCNDNLRDGVTTTTIPTTQTSCYGYNCDTDLRYGRHESYTDYATCYRTVRNKGLFIGSQTMSGSSAIYTRQNSAGTRYGYECQEERDYYPYWRPSIWRDIAIMTNDPDRCAAYLAASENVVGRYYCSPPAALLKSKATTSAWIPITQTACEALSIYDTTLNATTYGSWVQASSHGIAAPDCRENQWSRDNHHGNVANYNGFMASYNWTVPSDIISERCAVRMRYNISTGDTIEWNNNTVQVGYRGDSTSNPYPRNADDDTDPAMLAIIWERFGFNFSEVSDSFKGYTTAAQLVNSREYVLVNNPSVDIFGSLIGSENLSVLKTELAINTAQYGRTFQDRTHRFAIRSRPSSISSSANIYNLQVRGKRGNIVQVYPVTEYDFSPNRLSVANGDYVHFQWTGSNTNPTNNDGQGLAGTDRSNLVIQRSITFDDGDAVTTPTTYGHWGVNYPGTINGSLPFAGFATDVLGYLGTSQSSLTHAQFGGNMDQMNDAGTYFDLGPLQATTNGIYHYISTRNNAFSNRSQKGLLLVSDVAVTTNSLGVTGGTISTTGSQSLSAVAGTFTSLQSVSITATPKGTTSTAAVSDQASDFVTVYFDTSALTSSDSSLTVTLNYDTSLLHNVHVYRATSVSSDDWVKVASTTSSGRAAVVTSEPGTFAVSSKLNAGAIAGIVIGIVVFFALVGGVVYWVWRRNAGKALNSSLQVSMSSV